MIWQPNPVLLSPLLLVVLLVDRMDDVNVMDQQLLSLGVEPLLPLYSVLRYPLLFSASLSVLCGRKEILYKNMPIQMIELSKRRGGLW